MAAPLLVLGALEFVRGGLFGAVRDFEVERVEQDLDEGVRVVALQLKLAAFPAAVLTDLRTPLGVVEEEVGWPTEVLLSMGVVALAPVVNRRVADRAERRLVAVEHEFVVVQHALQVVEVLREAVFVHQGAHEGAALGTWPAEQTQRRSSAEATKTTYRMAGDSTFAPVR